MNRLSLTACLIAILAGCTGASYRAPKTLTRAGSSPAIVSRLPRLAAEAKPSYRCEENEIFAELARLADLSLVKLSLEEDRTGAGPLLPLVTPSGVLLPRLLLQGWVIEDETCVGAHQDFSGSATLRLPEIADLLRRQQTPDKRLIFWGSRSPARPSTLTSFTPKVLLLPGPDQEPTMLNPTSASLPDDALESSLRLPTGTAKVLIWRF